MKNKDQLPISPHLQIYKPQLTSVLSIAHRITGFCLSLTIPLYLIWIGCIFLGNSAYSFFINLCSTTFFDLVFIIMVYGFSYHMLNGIRHIFWDFGYGISIKFSSVSGVIIIISSTIIAIFFGFKVIS